MQNIIMQSHATAQWDGTINLHAYEEVEAFDNYQNEEALEQYRGERLNCYQGQVAFFKRRGVPDGGLRVVEVGSGSSVLLYAMEQGGILAEGVGIEIALSRHEFAERWKRDKEFSRVKNLHANFSDVDLPAAAFDYYLVIDNTFSYIYPEGADYPDRLLSQAMRCLKKGGSIVVTLNNYIPIINEMPRDEITFWKRLPESNAFRYALYHLQFNRGKNMLRTEGIYLTSNGAEKQKTELAFVYTADRLCALLQTHGFGIDVIAADFVGTPFIQNQSEQLVVTARKAL